MSQIVVTLSKTTIINSVFLLYSKTSLLDECCLFGFCCLLSHGLGTNLFDNEGCFKSIHSIFINNFNITILWHASCLKGSQHIITAFHQTITTTILWQILVWYGCQSR